MKPWHRIKSIMGLSGGCHACAETGDNGRNRIALVGSPNVGKSVIFNQLTGAYATVSNYPGTTVEIARGRVKLGGVEYEVVDTPGIYSLLPITGEEQVTRNLLLQEGLSAVLQVADAKDLERMLHLTLQLIEAGLPVILDLNMMDEAQGAGIELDIPHLEAELGIPVVATVATSGRGVAELKRRLAEHVVRRGCQN